MFPTVSCHLEEEPMIYEVRTYTGGEHDSCKIPGSPSERTETRRAISLVAR